LVEVSNSCEPLTCAVTPVASDTDSIAAAICEKLVPPEREHFAAQLARDTGPRGLHRPPVARLLVSVSCERQWCPCRCWLSRRTGQASIAEITCAAVTAVLLPSNVSVNVLVAELKLAAAPLIIVSVAVSLRNGRGGVDRS